MSTISASTTSTTAFKITTDTTGALVFQTGASPTTAMTLGSDQSVTFAGTPTYSGGTANGVAYLNGSKVLTTGTALVFDGTNLGIGTTSPSAKLHVNNGFLQVDISGTQAVRVGSSDSIVGGTDNNGILQTNTSKALLFYAGGSERMRINAGAPILCLAGGSTSATGTGIAFPATQSLSSDANTLDDYEEGSWTPSLRDGGTNRSPSYQYGPSGTYVKIGRLVFVRWGFKLTSKGAGSGSGEIQIYGLPFTPTNTGPYQEENVSISTGILNTAANAARARMVTSTSAYLFGRVADNADTTWTYADLTDTSWIIGEMCYIATT